MNKIPVLSLGSVCNKLGISYIKHASKNCKPEQILADHDSYVSRCVIDVVGVIKNFIFVL